MNPGKEKNLRTLLLTIWESNTKTQKNTHKKMTRFFSLKGTKSTPISTKLNPLRAIQREKKKIM